MNLRARFQKWKTPTSRTKMQQQFSAKCLSRVNLSRKRMVASKSWTLRTANASRSELLADTFSYLFSLSLFIPTLLLCFSLRLISLFWRRKARVYQGVSAASDGDWSASLDYSFEYPWEPKGPRICTRFRVRCVCLRICAIWYRWASLVAEEFL